VRDRGGRSDSCLNVPDVLDGRWGLELPRHTHRCEAGLTWASIFNQILHLKFWVLPHFLRGEFREGAEPKAAKLFSG
jgi:hypothetical protein